MKISKSFKSVIVHAISLLYVLLFVYASVSKLIDFENFQVQLGQSPLLSGFASWIAYLVPAIELLIVIFLFVPSLRLLGLYACFTLMVMFTSYIFIILNFSSFVPCSCGGILEKMSWKTHLIFNIVFVCLSGIAVTCSTNSDRFKSVIKAGYCLSISLLSGIALITVLYLLSEEIMQYSNPFLRRYNRRVLLYRGTVDLKYNSYYFSGTHNGKVYLGNYTAPLQILAIDSALKHNAIFKIDFKDKTIPFRSVRIAVHDNYFYLADGTVPCMYFGELRDWKIKGSFDSIPRFTIFKTVGAKSFIFRNNTGKASANIIGIYRGDQGDVVQYKPDLLQQQFNGIFDTDGTLSYDQKSKKIAYVYFYRNEFFTADQNAVLLRRGNTIDTISKAKIKVALLREGKRQKMAAPPMLVNAQSMLLNNVLFIESRIKGNNENETMWKYASIYDVYDAKTSGYIISFPVFGVDGDKPRSFYVTQTHFYALVGSKLVVYRFQGSLKIKINETHN